MEKEVKEIKKTKEKGKEKEIKPLVCSRILFVSVLDKIYLVILALVLISWTAIIFRGDTKALDYGFFDRVGYELILLIVLFIVYLFLNWFYKCAIKTMMCLTENEVYIEKYIPFKRSEASIPLNKITAVSTINLFWIFRCIIIHRYHQLPTIFWTWNNQEFKDKTDELLNKRTEKIENEFKDRNIIPKDKYKYVGYAGIILAVVIALFGIVRFFNYNFSEEKKLVGKYANDSKVVELDKDGSCTLSKDVTSRTVEECHWTYNKNSKEVYINYEYNYRSSYSYYSSTRYDSFKMKYDKKDKTLTKDEETYKRQK